jgi:hypothetical protein
MNVLPEAKWFKSGRSASGKDCVEVAHLAWGHGRSARLQEPDRPGARLHSLGAGRLHRWLPGSEFDRPC